LIPNPIRKVLSSMRAHRVRALLMGGQACVFYGAAEFSRGTDFAILADAANLARLRKALAELQAELIAVPPFAIRYLRRGHAIHFRCLHPEALRNWIRQAEADAGERDDRPTTAMIEENRRLVAENRELRRVNEVLRAASAYFASEIDPTRRRS